MRKVKNKRDGNGKNKVARTIMTREKDRFMFSNNWIQSWLKTGTFERGFTSIQKVNSCLF